MKINQPEVSISGELATISSTIEYQGQSRSLWYAVEREYHDFISSETLDAFLVGLLMLAMKLGEDIEIDGAVSEKLFYNITSSYMRILTSFMPSLQVVKILPNHLDRGNSFDSQGAVVTGFSAGIDSFCVLYDHLYHSVANSYKVTHFIYNNVGAFGAGGTELFKTRYQHLLNCSRELNIPFIKIDSNLHEILPIKFHKSHVPRNISAVLILQKFFSKYIYASAFKYEDCFVGKTEYMAYTDPVAVHLLSTENTECISSGCQYSRVEKTIQVSKIKTSYNYLNVCMNNSGVNNCSTCPKCLRTLLTLEILGQQNLYEQVFDLSKYRQVRHEYISRILRSNDTFDREILSLAKQKNYQFPWICKVASPRMILLFENTVKTCKKIAIYLTPVSLRAKIKKLMNSKS